MLAHEDFCSCIDEDPGKLAEHEKVNGMDRQAYLDDVQATYDDVMLLYRNYVQDDDVDKGNKMVFPLKQAIYSKIGRINFVINRIEIALNTPGEFDEATIFVDKDELESLLNQLTEYQAKLYALQYADVSELKNEIETSMNAASDMKRSVNIQLKQISMKDKLHSLSSSPMSSRSTTDSQSSISKSCENRGLPAVTSSNLIFNTQTSDHMPSLSLSNLSIREPEYSTSRINTTSTISSRVPMTSIFDPDFHNVQGVL